MRTANTLQVLAALVLLTLSSYSFAEDKRYQNIYQATHISAGWVAYSNGELYRCEFLTSDKRKAPNCIQATG